MATVALRRAMTSNMIIIIRDQDFFTQKMWEMITIYDQWTQCTKRVLDIITVNWQESAKVKIYLTIQRCTPFVCVTLIPSMTVQDFLIV